MSKSDLLSIEKEIQYQLEKHFADVEAPFFILGVSGGIDSMSLLYAFHRLQISVLVVHVNYGKRGEASDKDAELTEQLAYEWGFDCHTINADTKEAEGENFQQWARNLRYNIFRELAGEHEADGIAVAHHQDDQVETILQKVFRGTGLASWSGMQVWNGELFRPWLNITQEQIETYAEEKAIPYRIDASNLESGFARNFLRNEWLKDLEEHFPGWKSNVLRIAEQAEVFEHALSRLHEQVANGNNNFLRQKFHELEPSLQRAVILYAVKQVKPHAAISKKSLKRVEELPSLQTGKAVELAPGISVYRNRELYVLKAEQEDYSQNVELRIGEQLRKGEEFEELIFTLKEFKDVDYERELYLDAEKISWPLNVRPWKNGDTFQPLGMTGHQHVANHLTNRKISTAEKHKALVIESFEEKIIAVIFPPIKKRLPPGTIAEHAKCDASTRLCLNIKHRN